VTDTPSTNELLEQQRRARAKEQYDILILATVGVLPTTTTTVAYELPPTKVPVAWSGDIVEITSVVVEAGRPATTEYEAEADGWLKVRGHGRRTKKTGDVDTRAKWESFPLNPELAAPLLLAAMTRTPVVPKPPTRKSEAPMTTYIQDENEAGIGDWMAAFRRDSRRIATHELFRRLVREVAIDEQGSHPRYSWLSRNSITYAGWMTRGMPIVHKRRRSYQIATTITTDLDIYPTLPRGEGVGRVYAEAGPASG
jgi:hypothetical protein